MLEMHRRTLIISQIEVELEMHFKTEFEHKLRLISLSLILGLGMSSTKKFFGKFVQVIALVIRNYSG